MERIIKHRLLEIEKKYDIQILHACESGSRAWGFPSPDSDYDVRFIYAHPKNWYLSIDDKKDSIDIPINDELDISGWEIKKALRLFKKSNVPIFEHLQSPIVYANYEGFHKGLYGLSDDFFSPRAAIHHYASMAKNTVKSFDSGKVKLKRYFYALRTSLAAYWIATNGTIPPLQFNKLLVQIIDDVLTKKIHSLLELKAIENEPYMCNRDSFLEDFIDKTLDYCDTNSNRFEKKTTDSEKLDILFRKYVQ